MGGFCSTLRSCCCGASCCCDADPDPFPFDAAEAQAEFSGPFVSSAGLRIPEEHCITQPEIRVVVHAANRFFRSHCGQELLTDFAVAVSQTMQEEELRPLPSRRDFRRMVAGLLEPGASYRLQLPVLYTRMYRGDADRVDRQNRPEIHTIQCRSVTQNKNLGTLDAFFRQQVSFNIVRRERH
jgi:hypothetical protein